jgi:hypothetical protein
VDFGFADKCADGCVCVHDAQAATA